MTNSETARNELELDFTDLLTNGQGVARADGLVVFCFGPLPGERAVVRIVSRKPAYAVAELVRLVTSSPERADPFCPVFGDCGGCQVQHLAYDAQLRWKREIVRQTLQRIGGIGADVEQTVAGGSDRSYRNKVALVVEQQRGTSVVGFYRARSHELVAIDACPVVAPRLSEYIGFFAHASPQEPLGVLLGQAHHVVARTARAGGAVVSVTTPRQAHVLAEDAAEMVAALPGAVGLANSYEPRSANAVLGRHERLLAGTGDIEEEIAGIRYRVSPASFFQINVEIVERIFAQIERDLAAPRNVVDLYCGMGTFTLLFARRGARVVGVEENGRAVEEARANAQRNGLEARFHAKRVEQWVRSEDGASALRDAELVFLDPPRKGSDDATLGAIAAARVERVAYLSCDPATLARDLRLLVANGYRLHTVTPYDMFPQTGHVETLALLDRHG